MSDHFKDLSDGVVRFTVEDAVGESLFTRADGDIKSQTNVGVLAKL